MSEPIHRVEALKSLSREHYQGLLLCWKIRQGLKKNISPERIKKYIDWFWIQHLKNHFETEEKFLFPILGNKNEMIKQAIAEHRRLKRLFENKIDITKSISLIEEELEKHIRFEERLLFNEIQKVATTNDLEEISACHSTIFNDNWQDKFWLS
jgi:iron-sulfur cluster repair protein YtfE (RIC family)